MHAILAPFRRLHHEWQDSNVFEKFLIVFASSIGLVGFASQVAVQLVWGS